MISIISVSAHRFNLDDTHLIGKLTFRFMCNLSGLRNFRKDLRKISIAQEIYLKKILSSIIRNFLFDHTLPSRQVCSTNTNFYQIVSYGHPATYIEGKYS